MADIKDTLRSRLQAGDTLLQWCESPLAPQWMPAAALISERQERCFRERMELIRFAPLWKA